VAADEVDKRTHFAISLELALTVVFTFVTLTTAIPFKTVVKGKVGRFVLLPRIFNTREMSEAGR